MVAVREVALQDADSLLALQRRMDAETKFMLFEPGERTTDIVQQTKMIQHVLDSGNSMIFIAEEDGRPVGYLSALGGQAKRVRHRAYVVVGILEGHTGKGIGTALFQALESWRAKSPITRLELTVMAHNERGLALYRRMGFETEGLKRNSLQVDGRYVDEYYMAKIYEPGMA